VILDEHSDALQVVQAAVQCANSLEPVMSRSAGLSMATTLRKVRNDH